MSLTPWFKSPFTDFTGALLSHQWYGRCAKMEMKLMDCMEAYGLEKGRLKCDTLVDDFKECASQQKQVKRSMAMRYERNRQYHAGERSREELYAPPPKLDSW